MTRRPLTDNRYRINGPTRAEKSLPTSFWRKKLKIEQCSGGVREQDYRLSRGLAMLYVVMYSRHPNHRRESGRSSPPRREGNSLALRVDVHVPGEQAKTPAEGCRYQRRADGSPRIQIPSRVRTICLRCAVNVRRNSLERRAMLRRMMRRPAKGTERTFRSRVLA